MNMRRKLLDICGCCCSTHHQLSEHGVQLLRGGHGQAGLQHGHGVAVVVEVGDLWGFAAFEAAGKYGGQAAALRLLQPGRHGYSEDRNTTTGDRGGQEV